MKYVKVFLKGLAMGAADVVPGVSGGTIAFITGIYAQLLESIASVDFEALRLLRLEGVKAAWAHINGNFLLALGSGILIAIISLAKILHHLLETHPVMLWSFFFGLIVASCIHFARTLKQWRIQEVGFLTAGAVIAGLISIASPTEIEPTLPIVFVAGSLAICAMILPGISGSFILLLMGLYGPILAAVQTPDLALLSALGAGAGLGLIFFSRLLRWLLDHYESLLMALLTGFMVGSLVKVWPWKETLTTRINSKGEEVPLMQSHILPSVDDQLFFAALFMFVGASVVFLLERVAGGLSDEKV